MSVMEVDARIVERRREVRRERQLRRRRRTLSVVALLIALLIGLALERSPLVALAEVRVAGTQRLDVAAVVAAADLNLGTSTLRLGLGEATERVASLPLVAAVEIHRVDPLTVLIEVHERSPVLVAAGPTGTVLVSADGTVMSAGSEPGLPVVALTTPVPAVGEKVAALAPLANAFAAWSGLPGPLRTEVASLEARADDDLDVVFASGVRVRFGRAERVDEKARALGAVLEDVAGASVAVIDVRAPNNPVVQQ